MGYWWELLLPGCKITSIIGGGLGNPLLPTNESMPLLTDTNGIPVNSEPSHFEESQDGIPANGEPSHFEESQDCTIEKIPLISPTGT